LTKKSILTFYIFSILGFVLVGISIYLYTFKTTNENLKLNKNKVVSISGLPDLAIATQSSYIRHRSLSDTFSQYKDDPSLREYFPSTFTYTQGLK
jgi:uncharacterized membrane protein